MVTTTLRPSWKSLSIKSMKNMNPDNIPFHALIVGPTNSRKTRYPVNFLSTTFWEKFDYIVLLSPTFTHNKTYDHFTENDKDLLILTPLQSQIDDKLKIISYVRENKYTDHSRWLCCFERCEAEDEWTRELSGQNKTWGNLCLGPHTTDDKCCKTFQREHCCTCSLLHTICQRSEDHFQRLRGCVHEKWKWNGW